MKTYTVIGIILIMIGIVALACQGITYTTREKVVDIGPIQMTADKTKTIPIYINCFYFFVSSIKKLFHLK